MSPKKNGDGGMYIVEVQDLKIYVGERLLLDVDNMKVHKQDRIGLIGKNGSGKTTLLEALLGKKTLDTGKVTRRGTCEILPQFKRKDTTKSGGEVTQEYIIEALKKNADLLLADEPTTHLDTEHIEWLEKKLIHWQGALILVSHDRTFLDALCSKIWEIDEGKINEYKGNYSDYLQQKELKLRSQEAAYEKYEKTKRKLEEALVQKERKAAKATKKPKNVNLSEARNSKPYFAKKEKKLQKSVKAIETRIEKLEKVEKLKDVTPIQMDLPNEEAFKGRIVLRVENVPGQIGNRNLWKSTSFHVRGGDKLAIIGANGSGKTTLVKKIMNQAEGVSISPAVKIGYFDQTIDLLDEEQTILENVQSTSKQNETFIRIILARLHFFRDDVYKAVSVLSGGERVKVALAKLFVSDINTLILDEPTNFLDIEAVEALESLLKDYRGMILFISHDRRFISKIATRLLIIENEQIQFFEGSYDEYKNAQNPATRDSTEQLLVLETKISEVLSRLSIEPSEALEEEFQSLLAEKRNLNRS